MTRTQTALPVLMVGAGRRLESIPGLSVARVSWGETRSLGLNGWKVVVLGDRVLTGVDPADVREFIGKRQLRVIVSPDECDCRTLTPWIQAGFRDLVLPEHLGERLILDSAVDGRPDFKPRDWLPFEPVRSSPAGQASQAVANLARPFAVSEWSAALSWCRQKLWRVCTSGFDASPKTVLFWYVDTVVCAARAQDYSVEQVAAMLGYAEPAALAHAFQRRNRVIPARGHSCQHDCATCPLRAGWQDEAERSAAV